MRNFLLRWITCGVLLGVSPAFCQSHTPAQCAVSVVANDVVVPDRERRETAFHVLPAGTISEPSQWPYFAWSDTPLGVARSRDGSGYLFFGSDGGCHSDCSGTNPRSGSITRSVGTLDNPLGEPLGDPNPPVTEFLLPTSANLPDVIDYVGGGPVYRVPEGGLGGGSLLMVYHAERPATPFWSWLGLAKSSDEGITWQDLGLIIGGTHAFSAQGVLDIGDDGLVAANDPATGQKFFYVYFGQGCGINSTTRCPDFTYLSAARASYESVLQAAFLEGKAFPATGLFLKYHDGEWNQPGLDGRASELFHAVTGETDGDPEIVWSAYRNRFVAIMDNGYDIAYGESVDGLHWPPMQVFLASSGTPVYGYANAVGLGDDPNVLGATFYSYYTEFPIGVSWQPATLNRLTIKTECPD